MHVNFQRSAVSDNKQMMLTCLNARACGSEVGPLSPPSQTAEPPAHRKGLNWSGLNTERGKPAIEVLIAGKGLRKKANVSL
jgi:hypothetical protein